MTFPIRVFSETCRLTLYPETGPRVFYEDFLICSIRFQ